MEKKPRPRPEKSVSFTFREERRPPETSRNLSMGAIKARFGDTDDDFTFVFLEMDKFLAMAELPDPPHVPQRATRELLDMVEAQTSSAELTFSFLDAVDKLSLFVKAVSDRAAVDRGALPRADCALHRAMAFLEDELRHLLDDPGPSSPAASPKPPALDGAFSPDKTETLRRVAGAMVRAGFEPECTQAFALARRGALQSAVSAAGFENLSIEEVQKMPWEALEGEISSWLMAFRHVSTVFLPREKALCDAVFPPELAAALFLTLLRGAAHQLLAFAEAVALTRRSAEKLFKLLDMHEALRELGEEVGEWEGDSSALRADVESARCRLGEAAVGIFADLESSIRNDAGRTPVPGGAVHPLTRYVMNYLKYACEYKKTMEEVFLKSEGRGGSASQSLSPFAAQLLAVMDLLDANLESKSKLYKDPSLCHVFLMNNGRYILQKIKGAAEIHVLLGDTWCRRKSSDLRQYHKNYQRETWGKVLGCFRDEGLQVKGVISKPVLKERFRSFNAMFEEIHKTQSCWVVSDEQLQSELRVSVCSVVVPAYRSFLGRFQQYLDAGRQSEKYIKFAPEDLETFIDDLFDGTPASTVKRRS
ncbi:exocyst complex component EXO70C1-like [Wolffia australiana]